MGLLKLMCRPSHAACAHFQPLVQGAATLESQVLRQHHLGLH
jgi:hypothetical protein